MGLKNAIEKLLLQLFYGDFVFFILKKQTVFDKKLPLFTF